ncbi:hypothetical protein KR026_011962, partial [Drosophila bipectinata]
DVSIRVAATVFLADFLLRLFRCAVEYIRYSRYYLPEDRLWTILRRGCTYESKHVYLAMAFVIAGLSRISVTGDFRVVIPTALYLAQIPIYWLFFDLSRSTLTYSHWIREDHGLDYAAGMASNYFHGYLKLVLPESNNDGIKHRMAVYEVRNNITFGVDRLIILIPDEMFVNKVLESPLLQKAKVICHSFTLNSLLNIQKFDMQPLETRHLNRAGVYRPFKHDVYRLTKMINGKTYYFAMEGATPMLSFFDSMQSNLSATWQMKELQREIWLKFCKHLKDLIKTWPETRNEVDLLVYNAHDGNGDLVDIGDILIAHMKNQTKVVDKIAT